MGRIYKAKKPEKLGMGQVTPIQVAFIVDRYLLDNKYSQTLSVFRSEASILFSRSKTREAPKGLLSLGDILNDYVSLKEQKVLLEGEKCRVDKLLQGMQEVMRVYQSSSCDAAGVPSPTPKPESSTGKPSSMVMNSTPISINMTTPSSTVSLIPEVYHNNKREDSRSVLQPTSSIKKSSIQSPACPLNGTGAIPLDKQTNHNNNHKMAHQFTGYSQIQRASESPTSCTPPMPELAIANSAINQSSTPKRYSSSPKTPPQLYSAQTYTSQSPQEASSSPSVVQSSDALLEATPIDEHLFSSNGDIACCSGYTMHRGGPQYDFSPSKFGAKMFGKGQHVKGRLDFDDSGLFVNSDRCTDGASLPATGVVTMGNIDLDDILDFDILDNDVSLPYLDFVMDFPLVSLPDQSTVNQETSLILSQCSNGDANLEIDRVLSDLPLSSKAQVLSEKDMNRKDNDEHRTYKPTILCSKFSSPGKKKRRISSDQENVLRL